MRRWTAMDILIDTCQGLVQSTTWHTFTTADPSLHIKRFSSTLSRSVHSLRHYMSLISGFKAVFMQMSSYRTLFRRQYAKLLFSTQQLRQSVNGPPVIASLLSFIYCRFLECPICRKFKTRVCCALDDEYGHLSRLLAPLLWDRGIDIYFSWRDDGFNMAWRLSASGWWSMLWKISFGRR
ncbi:hypothetical protein FRC03_003135 [Tulasnella sp. 419]|nr:hypothetical protein FRC03_003135 [Tulasnella sp. 419]